jgi:hypothetical protein
MSFNQAGGCRTDGRTRRRARDGGHARGDEVDREEARGRRQVALSRAPLAHIWRRRLAPSTSRVARRRAPYCPRDHARCARCVRLADLRCARGDAPETRRSARTPSSRCLASTRRWRRERAAPSEGADAPSAPALATAGRSSPRRCPGGSGPYRGDRGYRAPSNRSRAPSPPPG